MAAIFDSLLPPLAHQLVFATWHPPTQTAAAHYKQTQRMCAQAVRAAAAQALAELGACPRSPELGLTAALDAEKKPAKKQQLEKVAAGAFRAALVAPFVEAAVAGKRVRRLFCHK